MYISDHYSLYFYAYEEILNQKRETFLYPGPYYNNLSIRNQIKNTNWNTIINQTSNVNTLYNNFQNKFCAIYTKSIKKKKVNKKRSNNPWITKEIVIECDIREREHELHKKWKNNGKNKRIEQEYKKYRN